MTCGYEHRRMEEVPSEWLERITTRVWSPRQIDFCQNCSVAGLGADASMVSDLVAVPGSAVNAITNTSPVKLPCNTDTQ